MLKKTLLFIGGNIFLGLSGIGLLVPGIPATPFLLLASYCFVRSSPRLNAALLRSRLFGPLLRDWQQHRGIRPRVKVVSIAFVAVAVGISIFSIPSFLGSILVGALACIGIAVICALPTVRETEPPERQDPESPPSENSDTSPGQTQS